MSEIFDTKIQDHTYIGKNTSLRGSFSFNGDTKISGSIEGEIEINSNFELSIEPSATVIADIKCSNINLYGKLEGKIFSSGTVTLYPSSTFTGELSSAQLVIQPGAKVNMTGQAQADTDSP